MRCAPYRAAKRAAAAARATAPIAAPPAGKKRTASRKAVFYEKPLFPKTLFVGCLGSDCSKRKNTKRPPQARFFSGFEAAFAVTMVLRRFLPPRRQHAMRHIFPCGAAQGGALPDTALPKGKPRLRFSRRDTRCALSHSSEALRRCLPSRSCPFPAHRRGPPRKAPSARSVPQAAPSCPACSHP